MSTYADAHAAEQRPSGGRAARLPERGWVGRAGRWLEGPGDFDGLFPARARNLGLVYVAVSVPVQVVLAALLAGSVHYVVLFAVMPVVTYMVPCFVLVHLAVRRTPAWAKDRPAYLLWFAGTVLVSVMSMGMLVGQLTDIHVANVAGVPAVAATTVLLNGGMVRLTCSRSGQRAPSVDMLEAIMAVVIITAPAALIWGDDIVSADQSWFTVPAALATAGMVFGIYWGLALVVRLGPDAGPLEICGLGVTVIGTANTVAQVAQGMSGFTLPAAPVMALHLTCSSLLFLVPLYLRWSPRPGLDRLPPQAQVRARSLATTVTLAGLPVLLVAAVVADRETTWAMPFTVAVLATLLGLAGLRQLAGVHETRNLYTQVQQAAEQRHRLLGQIIQRADEDRHRVARDLYEQSVFAYSSVASLFGTYDGAGPQSSSLAGATKVIRDDLADRAATRRSLMLATAPHPHAGGEGAGLAAPIRAYVDTLYGDMPAPRVTVTTSPRLHLDWATETAVLRIVEEALDNVRQHSGATEVHATVDVAGGITTVSISDDGMGFDPAATAAPGTGIPAMHAFAAVLGGVVHIDSSPGGGTTVVVRLGTDLPSPGANLRSVPPETSRGT